MTDKELAARKRLAKKLTALRKTLRKDEREILDSLVARPKAEVEGHEMAQSVYECYTIDNSVYTVYEVM